MDDERPALPYTICFCVHRERVLMLLRARPPFVDRWNGLGGKRVGSETPQRCVRREVREEAGIDLAHADRLRAVGTVTWPAGASRTGMYAYVAEFVDADVTWPGRRAVPEGQLEWLPSAWVCDHGNRAVVSNIPWFLPRMLTDEPPVEYHCDDPADNLERMLLRPLPTTSS
ncbi:NUDIX hydrolase [Actinophytocola xanthii]|uniref:Nudix hydrolase domain-containing protein n=1 Tax=Actinophytocola xanthii TaxID=1912961 RepID=A0A1Q8CNJ2_9PSEU|nr:NUDIX domain-containing protein [Actinophytocola xanthii]OLF15941.1 hypothetical protein BU204_18710 [Actinophytocola xanthii]